MAVGDKVYIADKPTLDSVNTKVGVNSNVAGTTTVFSRLRQIYEYLTTYLSSTRTAKIDNLDTTISSRQASWGAVAGTKTNIDNTWTRVNTNLDKKISEISGGDIIGTNYTATRCFRQISGGVYSGDSSNALTIFQVNGKGMCEIKNTETALSSFRYIQITRDGVVLPSVNWAQISNILVGVGGNLKIPFNSSLIIKTYLNTGQYSLGSSEFLRDAYVIETYLI